MSASAKPAEGFDRHFALLRRYRNDLDPDNVEEPFEIEATTLAVPAFDYKGQLGQRDGR
jgi:hypothetical protein